MSLAKCLIDFPVDPDDLAKIKRLIGKSGDEAKAVQAFAKTLDNELGGLRKQLVQKGHDVEAPVATRIDFATGKPERLETADKAVEEAVKAIIKKDLDLTDTELDAYAEEVFNNWTGSPDARLASDDPLHSAMFGQRLRGPMMRRELPVPDNDLLPYMDRNPLHYGMRYVRTMASDILMHERFGGVDAPLMRARLNTEKNAKQAAAKTADERQAIGDEFTAVMNDLEGMRDKLRGIYGHSPDAVMQKIGRIAQTASNFETSLSGGGFGLASIPDLATTIVRHGFRGSLGSSYRAAVKQLLRIDDTFKDVSNLYRNQIGVIADTLLRSRAGALNDINAVYNTGTVASRISHTAAETTVLLSGQTIMTDFQQSIVAISTGADILRMSKKLVAGTLGKKDTARLAAANIDLSKAERLLAAFNGEGGGTIHEGVFMPNVGAWTDRDIAKRFMHAISAEVDKSVVHPGLDTPLFFSQPVVGLLGKYKRIIAGMNSRVLIPAMQMRDANALSGVLTMVMLGMLTYAIRAPLAGVELSERPQDWIKEGVDRSGIMGWLQEFNAMTSQSTRGSIDLWGIIGANRPYSRYSSRSQLGAALGPMAGKSETILKVLAAAGSGEWSASDIHQLRLLLPLQNLFYIRQLLDRVEAHAADTFGIKPRKLN